MPSPEDIAHLRLIRTPRIGPKNFRKLLDEYGSAVAAIEHVPKLAAEAGVKGFELCAERRIVTELKEGAKLGAHPFFWGRTAYPKLLATAPDAPPFFWALGNTHLLRKRVLAIVGARNASSLGVRFARSLAAALGDAGFVIASGLARGIDMSAHEAALKTGTIAIQAGGLTTAYPPDAKALHGQIAKDGLLLSEHPFGLHPQARHFPRRNHILAGLAEALIVIEGASGSGSLITARAALDLGRDVMAVPGHPFDGRSTGCNALLKDGAILVRGPDDVIEALNTTPHEPEPITEKTPEQRPIKARSILSILSSTPCAEDSIIRDSGMPVHLATREIATLELEGRVVRDAGGRISLA
ncbi:MAG: DNA-processing protein DprA [Pseudomonadota bacterium]